MSVDITNPFFLPLGTQRYYQGLTYIQSLKPNFIIDFGCSECSFLFYVSRNPGDLQFSIGVDKNDRTLLKGHRSLSVPGVYYPHTRPYTIYLLQEDITKLSDEFIAKYKNCPFITIIEVIEHLSLSDLELAAEQIFNKLNPMAVYLTTPNIEYNDIISKNFDENRKQGQFRHVDHKFEWTRDEFRDWCNKICTKYNYSGIPEGVGTCTNDNEKKFGFASHSILFKNNLKIEEKKDFSPPEKFLYEDRFQIKIEGECENDFYRPDSEDERFLREEEEEEEEYKNESSNDADKE